jgi:ferredoxin
MNNVLTAIQNEARRILQEGVVDVVVGFEAGTLPLKAQPFFMNKADDVDKLVWNGFCQNNLATYLTRLDKQQRIGIICRGCDSRAVRALVLEHQHDREKLYLIGVPCTGIVDWRAVQRQTGEDILSAEEIGEEIVIATPQKKWKFSRAEMLHDSCKRCAHPNPVGVDITIGELLPEGDPQQAFTRTREFEFKSAEERYAYFQVEAERCIRCYACREACPMCYCSECFVDYTTPRWAESMITPSGTQAWHIIRAFHQAGRCVSCGACERACPMDIKMTYLTDKLNRDMLDLYGFEVGENDDKQPPFAAFSLDDRDRFVK